MLKLDNYQKLYYKHFFRTVNTLFPIITLFYLHRGASIFQVFLLSIIYSVVSIAFEVPTGIIGDKFGRKTSIVLGCLCMILHSVTYIFAHSFLWLAIGFSLFVIAKTFFSGSVEAFIYDSLKDEGKESQMNKYYSKYSSAANITSFIFPIVGAVIARGLTEQQFLVLLFMGLVGHIISFIFALSLEEPEHHKRQTKSSLELLKNSFKLLKSNRIILSLALNKGFIFLLFVAYWRMWQPYFSSTLLIPVALFGILLASSHGILYMLKQKVEYFEKKIGILSLLRWTAFIPLIAAVIFLLTKNPIVHIVVFFCIIIPLNFREPLFSKYLNVHICSKNRATALSLVSIFQNLVDMPIILLIGWIASISLTYALIPAMFLVIIAVTIFRVKEKHIC